MKIFSIFKICSLILLFFVYFVKIIRNLLDFCLIFSKVLNFGKLPILLKLTIFVLKHQFRKFISFKNFLESLSILEKLLIVVNLQQFWEDTIFGKFCRFLEILFSVKILSMWKICHFLKIFQIWKFSLLKEKLSFPMNLEYLKNLFVS